MCQHLGVPAAIAAPPVRLRAAVQHPPSDCDDYDDGADLISDPPDFDDGLDLTPDPPDFDNGVDWNALLRFLLVRDRKWQCEMLTEKAVDWNLMLMLGRREGGFHHRSG